MASVIESIDPAATVGSAVFEGATGRCVSVSCSMSSLLPCFQIAGLPMMGVRELRERVRSAIAESGFNFPRRRIVVDVTDAVPASGNTHMDLPVALAVLGASEKRSLEGVYALGELSLDGVVRPVRGSVAMAMAVPDGAKMLIVPRACAPAAALAAPQAFVVGVSSLREAWALAIGSDIPCRAAPAELTDDRSDFSNLLDVVGMGPARRALEIAAAGGHSLLLVGPAGAGKSMLARRLASILPSLDDDKALDVLAIADSCGLYRPGEQVSRQPPFRAPHHTASVAALAGSLRGVPGEVQLARHGVLMLDEYPEFSRAAQTAIPSHLVSSWSPIVVYTANLCPCGAEPSLCRCDLDHVKRFRLRWPAAAITVEVEPVPPTALLTAGRGESSEDVRQRVVAAQDLLARGIDCPADWVSPVASTIAALAGETMVTEEHMNEAKRLTEPHEAIYAAG